MPSRPLLSFYYDPEVECAVLRAGEFVLPSVVHSMNKRSAGEVAAFCARCAEFGGIRFPANLEQAPLKDAGALTDEFVSACVDQLKNALELAAKFPVRIQPEEAYVEAAFRGKLFEFDLALKAIVDEHACGGFVAGWSASDAYSRLVEALERNEWDIRPSLAEASLELREAAKES